MKPLSPLSTAARELLEEGSRVAPPSAEQSERMARTLAPLFESAGSALPGTAVSAPRGSGGTSRLLLGGSGKLLLAVGALAASHGASFWLGRVSSRVEQSAPQAVAGLAASVAPALAAPPPVTVLAPLAPPPAAPLATTPPPAALPSAAPSSAALPSRAHPPVNPGATGLRADIQRLSRADAELRGGRPSDALRLLATPVVRELREQAAALRAVAGCMLAASRAAGAADLASAQGDARAMLERFPDSPYEARVRSACER